MRDPGRQPFFFPPYMSTMWVGRRTGQGWLHSTLLSTLPGRLAWALYHRRRVPGRMARACRASRDASTRASRVWVSNERERYRAALLVPIGPGDRENLEELIEAVRHYEGDDIKIVVTDDLTGEFSDEIAARDFPGVDFIRPRVPAGSGLGSFRPQQLGFLHIADRYDVTTILRADVDALVVGSGSFEDATERFERDPNLAILGTTDRNAAGQETWDAYRWAAWMFHPEIRWSRRIRRLVRAAEHRVPSLRFAQGGAYFISANAVRAAVSQGLMPFRQPFLSLVTEDVITELIVQAAGLTIGSFGAPGEPMACDTVMPLDPDDVLAGGYKVVHSVRRTPSRMPEPEVRAVFRRARQDVAISGQLRSMPRSG